MAYWWNVGEYPPVSSNMGPAIIGHLNGNTI